MNKFFAYTAITASVLFSHHSLAVEPSPVEATGVISEQYNINASNWDNAPASMLSFTQTEHIFPTMLISRGDGPASSLNYSEKQIDTQTLIIKDPVTDQPITAEQLLNRRMQNNGLVVIHKDKIVHESYRNGLSPDKRHLNFSTTKSMVGLLAQIAIEKGLFTPEELVIKYVPELRIKDAWQEVTIQQVMDMRDGTKFIEEYEDENSDVRVQDRAIGWRSRTGSDPQGLKDFIVKSENLGDRINPLGEVFNYASIQTEILGLVIEQAAQKPLTEFFEQELWSKIGAEQSAGFATDGYGQALAQGGMSMTLRDFARVAKLVLNKGRNFSGEQVISPSFFEELYAPNQALNQAFKKYHSLAPNGSYRNQFWVLDDEKQQFMMAGVYGQLAYFDIKNDFALVAFGAFPVAKHPMLTGSQFGLIEAMLQAAKSL